MTSQNPNHQPSSRTTRPADYKDVNGSPNVIDWLVNAIVLVITWPIMFLAKLLNAFVERGSVGIQALGAVAFLIGVLAGADNFYQLFTGKALLPWFTDADWVGDLALVNLPFALSWITNIWGGTTFVGWAAVAIHLVSIGFLIALSLSLLTQFIQGQAVRGKTLDAAKADFAHWNSESLPGKPDEGKKLDMAVVSWEQLKSTGRNQNKFMSGIALSLWAFEFVSAFAAHNPLNYTGRAGLFIGCTLYALVTIGAGEIGYTIFIAAKEESNQA